MRIFNFLLVLSFGVSVHATDGVERTLILAKKMQSCEPRLTTTPLDIKSIRSAASLRRAVESRADAQLIAGSWDAPYGLLIAVFPDLDESTDLVLMRFVILNTSRAEYFNHFEAALVGSYLDSMIENAMFPLRNKLGPKDSHARRSLTALYDDEDGTSATAKIQFYVAPTKFSTDDLRLVATLLLDWDRTVRTKLFP